MEGRGRRGEEEGEEAVSSWCKPVPRMALAAGGRVGASDAPAAATSGSVARALRRQADAPGAHGVLHERSCGGRRDAHHAGVD